MSQVLDPLTTGREAAASGAWRQAYDAFSAAPNADLTPDDVERFADAAWLTGRHDQAVELRERAFAGFSAAGDEARAARLALALTWDYEGRGAFAVSHGWFARAERLIEALPESALHAHAALHRGMKALFVEGDAETAMPEIERAHELGRRFGDSNAQALALVMKGRIFVQSGEVDRGLALLDEATTAAVSGELEPFVTNLVYCATISSCNDIGDLRRAAEWTEVANKWCDRSEVTGFPGACRIHRAEIMRLRGDWGAAEQQAVEACEELFDFDKMITAGGFYEIGEIRRRRGDFAGAEEAYRQAAEWNREPQPGLALLRLAQGKVDAAATALKRSLEGTHEPLYRVKRLPAQVEIAVAVRDLATARAAAEELESIVEAYKIAGRTAPAFDAIVHLAWGQIELAEGDLPAAGRCLRRARDEWKNVGAPYETAIARTLLGLTYRREGDEDGAMDELEAALATFERLGAMLDAERVKELLGRLETRRTFMFTDIVDSTKLASSLGDEKWKKLLARHDELLREQIVDSGGEVIQRTGDGYFASFAHPKAAIEAAVGIQRALDGEIVAPDVRIGLHTGGAFHKDGDFTDYGGEGVHAAARVGAAAGKGEILISTATLDGVGTAFRLSEPRTVELKGFDEPLELVSVGWR